MPPADYLLVEGAKQLTFEGDNDDARFSPNEDRVIFISRKRPSHPNTQAYEIHLARNSERRITYQDGEIRHPTYTADNRIIYASTTDEIKESLAESRKISAVVDFPPTEIYQSDLYGNDIHRLTDHPGYDAEAIPVANKFLFYTSFREGHLGIYKYDLKSKVSVAFLAERGKNFWSPTLSSDYQHLAWLEKDLSSPSVRMMWMSLKDMKGQKLKEEAFEIRDLRFVPKSPHGTYQLIYSVRKNNKPFQIEIFDIEKACTQVVFSGLDSLYQPVMSARQPAQVLFTRALKDSRQVYLVPFPQDLRCLPSP